MGFMDLDTKLVPLARELAMGIYPLQDIMKRLEISQAELDRLSELPKFRHLLEQITMEWGSTLNTAERIKFKSLAGLEE